MELSLLKDDGMDMYTWDHILTCVSRSGGFIIV